ncbi:hypothetical protein BDZ91DRAFT_715898 [Kalaharituber pfeilii]|nr:hypothetical protein BDZ91DRAFT_715898 [Kalaharituber pfeilii]
MDPVIVQLLLSAEDVGDWKGRCQVFWGHYGDAIAAWRVWQSGADAKLSLRYAAGAPILRRELWDVRFWRGRTDVSTNEHVLNGPWRACGTASDSFTRRWKHGEYDVKPSLWIGRSRCGFGSPIVFTKSESRLGRCLNLGLK